MKGEERIDEFEKILPREGLGSSFLPAYLTLLTAHLLSFHHSPSSRVAL